jgi:DivIVA domain-containing protein
MPGNPVADSRYLSPEQVHKVAFGKPPIGKRGYHEDEVDAFLDRVEAALRDPTRGLLTAEQVRNVAFGKPPAGRRGYNEDEVDAFLDLVAQQLGRSPQSRHHEVAAEPTAESYPPLRGMTIQPNLFLFWNPVWHDWRTSGSGTADTSGDSGNLVVDVIWNFLGALVFERLWNWFLWAVWAAIAWVLEALGAVVLSPPALLTSLLGIRRHRLVADSAVDDAQYLLSSGSWYKMRRARAEARTVLAYAFDAADRRAVDARNEGTP